MEYLLKWLLSAESDALSVTSSQSGQIYTSHVRDSKSSISSDKYGHSQLSATESSRGDDFHDEMDNDSLGGRLPYQQGMYFFYRSEVDLDYMLALVRGNYSCITYALLHSFMEFGFFAMFYMKVKKP